MEFSIEVQRAQLGINQVKAKEITLMVLGTKKSHKSTELKVTLAKTNQKSTHYKKSTSRNSLDDSILNFLLFK